MNVCEKLKELTVSIIKLDLLAIENLCETISTQEELLKLYQESGKSIEFLAGKFFVTPETMQAWIYLPSTHRKGLKEPRRSQLERYLMQCLIE